jgi:hypothetical protein
VSGRQDHSADGRISSVESYDCLKLWRYEELRGEVTGRLNGNFLPEVVYRGSDKMPAGCDVISSLRKLAPNVYSGRFSVRWSSSEYMSNVVLSAEFSLDSTSHWRLLDPSFVSRRLRRDIPPKRQSIFMTSCPGIGVTDIRM